MKRSWIFFIFLSLGKYAFTQIGPIQIQGKVYKNSDSLTTLDQVVVIRKGDLTGYLTRIDGYFKAQVKKGDTVMFRRKGYYPDTLIIQHDSFRLYKIYLIEIPVVLKGITFRTPKKIDLEERRKEWAHILDRPKPSASSPISALYEQFSKKGKELRKLEKLFYEDEKRIYTKQRVNRTLCYQISKATGTQLDSFMMYATPHYEWLITMSDLELVIHLEQAWVRFQQLYGYRKD